MAQTLSKWEELIVEVKSKYPHVSSASYKFKQMVVARVAAYDLSPNEVKQVASYLGIRLHLKPTNIPEDWKLSLCKSYLSEKYTNNNDPYEYCVVVPKNYGHLPYLIHRTSVGYADITWFKEVIPELEKIIKDPTIGYSFSRKFNAAVNQLFDKGMKPGQVQALNLFFGKYVPGIEGVCTTCYKVSLPMSGAGEKWTNRKDERYEVRLSAAKPQSPHPGQQIEYVSHTELDGRNEEIFATWNKKKGVAGFDKKMDQEDTHIPWDVYDFNKFSVGMPLCRCRKK